MPSSDNNRIALSFKLQPSTGNGSKYASVEATAIRIGTDGDIGYGYSQEWLAVEGISARAGGWSDNPESAFQDFGTVIELDSYRHSIDEWQAERAHKLLKSTRTKLERMVTSGYGEPATFGAYVARVCKALKIEHIAFVRPEGGRWANGEVFMVQNLAEGSRHIDYMIRQWRDGATAANTAVAQPETIIAS